MKVTLAPSAAHNGAGQFLTTYLINDVLAIDAGAVGLLPLPQQSSITDVILTHSHLDHVATLPVFLDNVYKTRPDCITVHAADVTLEAIRHGLFNGQLWPKLGELTGSSPPFLRIATLEAGRPLDVAGLRIMPFPVDHAVPTLGLLVEEPDAAVVFSSDTGPTDILWHHANQAEDLKAVFLEASFPDRLIAVARSSKHLTPSLFAHEVAKLTRPAAVIAVHIKPRFFAEVAAELNALATPNLQIGEPGRTYVF